MAIGILVKHHIEKIFQYCEDQDHGELENLADKDYSKETFGIYFPFYKESALISEEEGVRYWADLYHVRGKTVRASSQWFLRNRQRFIDYIVKKGIADQDLIDSLNAADNNIKNRPKSVTRVNSRFKGNAIGNAQNSLIRTILSNLGEESFKKKDWEKTKAYFHNKCAYCGSDKEIVMDHVVPINRKSFGEHRLGNLVPSCKSCNKNKGSKEYQIFLEGQEDRISAINKYMEDKNYKPLGENEEVAKLLEMAYKEVAIVSDRYIEILNTILHNK